MANRIGDLAVYVIDGQGHTHWLMPGDAVPDWAASQLGAHCLVVGASHPGPAPTIPADSGPPPRSGRGSGESQWRAYAEFHGVDVTLIEGRDDIIDACEAAGVAVE